MKYILIILLLSCSIQARSQDFQVGSPLDSIRRVISSSTSITIEREDSIAFTEHQYLFKIDTLFLRNVYLESSEGGFYGYERIIAQAGLSREGVPQSGIATDVKWTSNDSISQRDYIYFFGHITNLQGHAPDDEGQVKDTAFSFWHDRWPINVTYTRTTGKLTFERAMVAGFVERTKKQKKHNQ